jgi:hypothetical protein
MVVDISVALTWLLFLALFPMAFFWLRAAWRIGVKKDYSEVALKHGVGPSDQARFAPYALLINGVAGSAALLAISMVLIGQVPYEQWTALAGVTIWLKLIASFALSRHAHGHLAKRA